MLDHFTLPTWVEILHMVDPCVFSGGSTVTERRCELLGFVELGVSGTVLVGRMVARGNLGVSIKLTPTLVEASTREEVEE